MFIYQSKTSLQRLSTESFDVLHIQEHRMSPSTVISIFTDIYKYITLDQSSRDQQQGLNAILSFLYTIWGYRPVLTIEFTLIAVIGMLSFVCYTMLQKINITTPKAPNSYNHETNINVWLNQVEDYLDVNKIKSDRARQDTLLQRLDRTNRQALQKLIENKTIRTYNDLQNHVRTLYSKDVQTTKDHIINFVQRKQFPQETIGDYYGSIVELAKKAYPKLNPKDLEQQIADTFVNGLNNFVIKHHLLTNSDKNDKNNSTDVLTRAIRLHADMGDSINDYNTLTSPIDVNHVSTQRCQANTPLTNVNQQDTYCNFQPVDQNRMSNNQSNNQANRSNNSNRSNFNQSNTSDSTNSSARRIICYNCNNEGHTSRYCNQSRDRNQRPLERNQQSNNSNHQAPQVLSTQTGTKQQ